MWIDKARPQLMGHVFVNPVDENAYMAMLWYAFILHLLLNLLQTGET